MDTIARKSDIKSATMPNSLESATTQPPSTYLSLMPSIGTPMSRYHSNDVAPNLWADSALGKTIKFGDVLLESHRMLGQ